MKRKICILGLALVLLCASSCADGSCDSDDRTSSAGTTEQTAAAAKESGTDTETELPEEAKNAVLAYVKSDSYESLVDSILPTSAAEKVKNGKITIGNYFFGFETFPCEDAKILECTKMPEDRAQRLAAFWATGFSMKGVSVDFTADEGYDTVVSAVCSLPSEGAEPEMLRYRFTRRLELLKISNDRWIVVPSSDEAANSMEPIQ